MEEQERLRLDYEQTAQRLRDLTETRFRLLAIVPSLAGAVVAFVSSSSAGIELLAIGLLGLAATTGILLYELRNSEIRAAAAARLRRLEDALLPERAFVPPDAREPVSHSAALALVYGAALAGWCYLVVWGALKVGDVGHARQVGVALGAAAGVSAAAAVHRFEERIGRASESRPAPEAA